MSLNVTTEIAALLPMLHAASLSDLVFWSDAEITRYYHDRLLAHAQQFGVFVARDVTTVTLVQGTATYALPAGLLDVMHVALDGVPLIPATTNELEAEDDLFATTQATLTAPIKRWYSDRIGQNRVGVQPVPAAGDAGKHLDIIYHGYVCDLDPAHTVTAINVPAPIGVLLKMQVLAECYGAESDGRMPEVARSALGLASLLEQVTAGYYGVSQ